MIQLSEDTLEDQIHQYQRTIFYDTREYCVGNIVHSYLKGKENGKNTFFIPEDQKDIVWNAFQQSRFIESLMIGMPVPFILIAEASHGRYEVVDGSQRIRTLAAYLNGDLEIEGLKKISKLNGLRFSDLDLSRQRRFKNVSLLVVVLSNLASQEIIHDVFERMNTGNNLLKHKSNSIVEKDNIE